MATEEEDSDIKDLPLIAVPIIFILVTMVLFSSDFYTQEPTIFLTISGVTLAITGGFVYLVKKKISDEGIVDALKLAVTPIEDLDNLGNNSDNSIDNDRTPPASESLKNELYFERAERKCEWCGQEVDSPDVHHIKPREEGGPNKKSNLIVLCPTCHRKADRGSISRSKLRYKVRESRDS